MEKKFCNHCGRLYIGKCSCRTDTKREYKRNSFYDTKGWRSCSKYVRMRDYNMDRLQMYFRKFEPTNETEQKLYDFVMDATGDTRNFDGRLVVHHINELEDEWSRRYDTDNLITVNYHTHEYIHQLYLGEHKDKVQALLLKAVKSVLP